MDYHTALKMPVERMNGNLRFEKRSTCFSNDEQFHQSLNAADELIDTFARFGSGFSPLGVSAHFLTWHAYNISSRWRCCQCVPGCLERRRHFSLRWRACYFVAKEV